MENSSFGGYSGDFWLAKVMQFAIAVAAFIAVIRIDEAIDDPARTGGDTFLYVLAFAVSAVGIVSIGYFILDWRKELQDPLDKPRVKRPNRTADGGDKLTCIEGIGPKVAELLQEDGYRTFKDIAKAEPAELKSVLEAAGSRFRMHDTKTWPAQAKLAAKGEWIKLQAMQDELTAGK